MLIKAFHLIEKALKALSLSYADKRPHITLNQLITMWIILIIMGISNAQSQSQHKRIWIDTDPACGHSSSSDVDDCLAITAMLASSEVNIVGISTVFGNESINITHKVARNLIQKAINNGMYSAPIYAGARSRRTVSSQASKALIEALESGPLTILALGPLTNIATALKARPDLSKNLIEVVAVMGKRPGQVFRPAEGSSRSIFGRIITFSDLNFSKDPQAAKQVLNSDVPVTLTPYELSRQVEITSHNLDLMAAKGNISQWLAGQSRQWLRFWTDIIGREGFYPFDLIAAAYLLEPRSFRCDNKIATIERDSSRHIFGLGPESLLVRNSAKYHHNQALVSYCSGFKNLVEFNLDKFLY